MNFGVTHHSVHNTTSSASSSPTLCLLMPYNLHLGNLEVWIVSTWCSTLLYIFFDFFSFRLEYHMNILTHLLELNSGTISRTYMLNLWTRSISLSLSLGTLSAPLAQQILYYVVTLCMCCFSFLSIKCLNYRDCIIYIFMPRDKHSAWSMVDTQNICC